MDIHPLYILVSWTSYLILCVLLLYSTDTEQIFIYRINRSAGFPICVCCCWIRRVQIKYSSAVWIGQPDMVSNIVCVLLLDQADTE